jgi:uncharacterized membrane protein
MLPAVPTFHARLHPLHAILLAATLPLFLGALLSDIAYWKSYEIQWNNFASWLLAGGLLVGAIALVAALVALVRAGGDRGWHLLYFLLLLAAWALGFIDVLVHARDAWATMPSGLVLSVVVAAILCVAKWIALCGLCAPSTP